MYPSSSSSSFSQKPINSIATAASLTRYGSAPSSLIASAVDSVGGGASTAPTDRDQFSSLGSQPQPPSQHAPQSSSATLVGHYFSGDSSCLTSESTCKVNSSTSTSTDPKHHNKNTTGLQRSYGFNEIAIGGSLLRQRSSPAGFFTNLNAENAGFTVTKESGGYSSQGGGSNGGHGVGRLKSQLSFTRQDSVSQISEASENGVDGISSDDGRHKATHSYATTRFGIDSWENGNSIVFSPPSSKRARNDIDGDFFNCLNGLETQFSLPQTTLEMATVEQLLHIPEDSVPCKIRAKRGCATHPRSIAERERRTRISGKLKKLQELVPNMDKQTSYSDMLDLAVQHIKGLQNQVQKLHKELESCTCGCKPTTS